MRKISCRKCPKPESCCQEGVSIDLNEAKKILSLGLSGEFFHLEIDKDFPSGYRIDTSMGHDPCTFLTRNGLCSIHKVSYKFKPTPCKDFPIAPDGTVSSDVKKLCAGYKQKRKKKVWRRKRKK